ncbi:MAG: putative lipid II flippase FtsW [Bacteroidetes bacterium]|nr:putative lipid II flippase FtsW [Bacteroidota bacterium]MBU2584929.1 putative lipid II flippase FtsW [Bacteroidota bacterium]
MNKGRVDISIFLVVLGLLLFSLIVVYSASSFYSTYKWGDSEFLFGNHLGKVFFGIVALFVFTRIPYQYYQKYSKEILIISIVLLAITAGFGKTVKGAARQIIIGGFGFQPSILALYAVVIHLSSLIVKKGEAIKDLKFGYLPSIAWLGVVAALIMWQPNFSTAILSLIIGLSLLYLGGARFKHILTTVLMALPFLFVYLADTDSYRYTRIKNFADGIFSSKAINYQVDQASLAFGSGGITGNGIGDSRIRELWLPEAYGDFIYAIIGEEYGFIGAVIILSLFLFILWRGFRIARNAPDPFGRLLAFGITFSIGLYAFVNAGVTVGILPTTGLPLPFLSYGGTAILFNALAIGILLNISSSIYQQEEFNAETTLVTR